jgi:hypothetical protein
MATRIRTRVGVAAGALAVLLMAVGATVVRADPSPALPPVTAAQLLASVATAASAPSSISGEVRTTVDLGLPELPASLGGGAAGPLASLTGTQRYKVWASPDGLRVAHLSDLGEEVWVTNHTTAWHWSSDGMRAERIHLADVAAALRSAVRAHSDASGNSDGSHGWGGLFGGAQGPSGTSVPTLADPATMAREALRALAPYGTVAVDATARVAGRPVYQLTLTPSSRLTLVGGITVAIDAETRIPLRLQVFARGSDSPAIEAGFASVSFAPIDPGVFAFTPPQGATIMTPKPRADASAPSPPDAMKARDVRTFGRGFDARVAVRVDPAVAARLATVLPYQGPLASALSVRAGGSTWILVGPVGLDTLRSDASSLS